MYEYEKNKWEKYQEGIPVEDQVNSIITKTKLDNIERGIERASMTLEVGNVTTGSKPAVSVTEDTIQHRRLINVVFPEGGGSSSTAIDDIKPSSNTTYSSERIESLIQDLRKELSGSAAPTAIKINSFTGLSSYYEKGQVITTITFRWSTNIECVSATINGEPINTNINSAYYLTMMDDTTSFTLRVTDKNGNTDSKTITAYFIYPKLSGVSMETDLQALKDVSFNKHFINSNSVTFTETAGEGEYIYYLDPILSHEAEFYQGGFQGGFEELGTIDITNAYGYTTSYRVWKSVQQYLGRTTVEVK